MSQNRYEINSALLGTNFLELSDNDFKKIDSISCFKYGVGYKYNRISISPEVEKFYFIGFSITKLALKVENGVIEDMLCFVRFEDFDKFYKAILDNYKAPSTISVHKRETTIEKEGSTSISEKIDDNILLPNFKDIKNLGWHNINTNLKDSRETSLYVDLFPNQSSKLNDSFIARVELIVHKD